ncbi:MAG: serine/threonine protein kinase [Kofleriaceae bacterium]|nr:serine/threonine protein kinase [Kofleriaceae bacterium]
MEGKTKAKVTKEVLCEEARFILANVMAESKYGRQNSYDDIRRVCEGAVSIPFTEYVGFLVASGYLNHDRHKESLEVTSMGEDVVNGGSLTELTVQAVSHFKSARGRNRGQNTGSSEASPPRRDREEPRRPDRDRERERPRPERKERGASSERNYSEALDSRYEKLASIGSGGVGTVYRARQVPLNRQVALKEIRDLFSFFSEEQRPEIVRRFTDVVRAHADLAHPNILPIHDVNLEKEFPYVVSELCPNGSVRRLITDAETIPVSLALKYLLQTLHALQAAHRERVSHRGLKPENMLIDAHGNVKVSDFGFSRIVERDQSVIRQVYVGMGTVAYMAPELFSDPTGAGPQADIYALGIIFYELLTRKLPGRRSPMPSEIDPKLPVGLDDIFDNMTKDSRTERYSTVDEILEDFNKIESLNEVLDQQQQVLAAENPLDDIKFKEGSLTEKPVEPVETSAGSSSSSSSSSKRRPYSYQQRQKKN